MPAVYHFSRLDFVCHLAASHTECVYRALVRDDNYVSPPVTATTRSGKVYKTSAPSRLSKSTSHVPTTDIDGKIESVTDVAEKASVSTASRLSKRSSSTYPIYDN